MISTRRIVIFIILSNVRSTLSRHQMGISFEPPGEPKNRSIYLVKAGAERFGITCVYTGDDARGQHAMQWINENGGTIFNSNSVIVLANAKNKYDYEKKLIFKNIKKHDTGEYRCRMQLRDAGFVERPIFIKVINNIEWNHPDGRIAGNLGEQLTIDCGASGNPKPQIEIAGPRGLSMEDVGYTVIESKVTIPRLAERHQNLTIRCLAIQKVDVAGQFNTTTADEHDIGVDVYYEELVNGSLSTHLLRLTPRFEFTEVEVYASTGKNATLQCLVSGSHPRVTKFDFYRDNSIIFNHERYEVATDFVHQMATLRITGVEDDDYGRYRCVAKNAKLTGEQILVLKKTSPPKQPYVDVLAVDNNSVTLQIINNRDEDDLPILCYAVSYIPRYRSGTGLNRPQTSGDGTTVFGAAGGRKGDGQLKNTERHNVKFSLNSNNTYVMQNLRPNVKYEFFIRPVNEVGEGDPVMMSVITSSPDHTADDGTLNGAFAQSAPIWLIIAACTVHLGLCRPRLIQ